MNPRAYTLHRNAFGRLDLTMNATGETHKNVTPARAFPITSPDSGLSLVDSAGKELAWIERIDILPNETAALILEELAAREFMPVISRIVSVSSYATPSLWDVQTDRGDAQLLLNGEEDIRRLTPPSLLITDSHGIHYLIRDIQRLDRQSKKILDRFL
jgi:hypothetical protein